jgi:hypothetical protein
MKHTPHRLQPTNQQSLVNFIYLLALIKFILPYFIQSPVYEPHRDEFLYLAEGHHLAWGYLEVPPMLSIFGWIANVMGGGMFWIKFGPSLFGAFTYILVGRIVLLFQGRWFALVLGFMPFVLGYFLHVHFMLQPNFLEMFFWTLMAYGLIYYVKTGLPKGLYIAGIAFGLGMMSKYSVSFFAFGLLAGLLLTKERKVLLNRHFYYAMLVGFIIFLPNITWQWLHGFPFIHQANELQDKQLKNIANVDFIKGQLLYNLPCIVTWLAGLYWVSFTAAGKQYRFIGWGFLIAMTILVAGHGKSYYGMPAYPVLFGFGAVWLEKLTMDRYAYLRYAIITFSIITGVLLDTVMLPFLPPQQLAAFYAKSNLFSESGFLKWEDQKNHPLPQDFADMLSWREMTGKASKIYNALPGTDKSKTIIDCDNYGEAAAVDYFGPGYHLASPMGHSASYLFWTPLSVFYNNDNFIIITDYRNEIHEGFVKEFQYAAVVDSVTTPYAREFGSYIIILKHPSQKFRKVWQGYYISMRDDMSIFHK